MAYEEPRMFDSRRFGRYEKYCGKPIWTHINGLEPDGNWYITTNLRVIMQGGYATDKEAFDNCYDRNWLKDVYDFWCEPTEYHDKRRTFTMWMSRGCTDDNRTHISMSSICESTRFCNYGKDKFDNQLTWIKPYWIREETLNAWVNEDEDYFMKDDCSDEEWDKRMVELMFLERMEDEEADYLTMANEGLQAQQLKRLFPLGVKAELRLCGFDDAWQNFFWRRCDEHADPECVIVANKIKEMY
jgi:thymidylate synthase (FAD)